MSAHQRDNLELTKSNDRPGGEVNIFAVLELEGEIRRHERAITKLKRSRSSLLDEATLPPQSQ